MKNSQQIQGFNNELAVVLHKYDLQIEVNTKQQHPEFFACQGQEGNFEVQLGQGLISPCWIADKETLTVLGYYGKEYINEEINNTTDFHQLYFALQGVGINERTQAYYNFRKEIEDIITRDTTEYFTRKKDKNDEKLTTDK